LYQPDGKISHRKRIVLTRILFIYAAPLKAGFDLKDFIKIIRQTINSYQVSFESMMCLSSEQ
jgi:hypothetical protein